MYIYIPSFKKLTLLRVVISLQLLIFVFGCSSLTPRKQSIKEIYDAADTLYANEKYLKAKEKYEEVVQRDPLNRYAILSELHIADILFIRERYNESRMHYEEYLRLNPKAIEREYVLYRIGMSYFNTILTFDRDQTATMLAIDKFEEYFKFYPSGRYKTELDEKHEIALTTKIKSEYNVGQFYYDMGNFNAAAVRFENIVQENKKSELLEDSYFSLAKSLEMLNKKDKLKNVYDDYLMKFPNGKYKHDLLVFLN